MEAAIDEKKEQVCRSSATADGASGNSTIIELSIHFCKAKSYIVACSCSISG
jgi:hypothetical protein